LGIRPPKNSFSWVPDKQLDDQGGDLAEVLDDDVACRIGSELSDKRNAVQVKLKRGEVVEILGREEVEGETWCKIGPPAGEFRWVHAATIKNLGPVSAAAAAEEIATVVPAIATSQAVTIEAEAKTDATAKNESAAQTNSSASGDSWRASTAPTPPQTPSATPPAEIAPPPLSSITPVEAPAATPATPSGAPSPTTSTASTRAPAPPTAAPPSLDTAGVDLPRQLTDIELRLSRMASAPPQLWNTERLQRDAEQLLARAQTQAERDMIKATLTKIDKFTSLARRYQQPVSAASGDRDAASSVDSRMTLNSATPGAMAADARYDAVGVLRPVVSKRAGAPQFALVDERGQVITFVTPTPDVNLQPYLGRRVGIAGNRGFIPEFNRAHVTAGRVTPLTERVLR
jgi:hypothetical protein